MNEYLVRIFEHNRWANLPLVDACLALDPGTLDRTVPGTFGTVRETLAHIAGAETRYLLAIHGRHPDAEGRVEDRNLGLADLRAALARTGDDFVAVARDAAPSRAVVSWRNDERIPLAVLLTQAINHATEHRAQIATILTQAGIMPPEMDGWTWFRTP